MGLRFRQSFTIIPGIRLNVSKSGLSASIGGAPFTVNIGPHGLTETLSLPGSGISYRHHETFPSSTPNCDNQALPRDARPSPVLPTPAFPTIPVHSASAEVMTSVTLQELKKLVLTANNQYREISSDLDTAYREQASANTRFTSWDRGWLFKRLFKDQFEKRRVASEETTAKSSELETQREASRLSLDIDIEEGPQNAYHLMVEAFSHMVGCRGVWDIQSHRRVDQWHERTFADDAIEKTSVSFGKDACALLKSDLRVPHLPNSKGGGLYFYPGFILYTASRDDFSLIEYSDVTCKSPRISFIESGTLPPDAKVTGQTWQYANKDGSRDRRFASNREIPVVEYGGLNFTSAAGLREEFMLSQFASVNEFVMRLSEFTDTLSSAPTQVASEPANQQSRGRIEPKPLPPRDTVSNSHGLEHQRGAFQELARVRACRPIDEKEGCLTIRVRGANHSGPDGLQRWEHYLYFEPGHPLTLVHESENEFDDNAVAVVGPDWRKVEVHLGYIPKDFATRLVHEHFDRGKRVNAWVYRVEKCDTPRYAPLTLLIQLEFV
jgi:hypothetical protein